MDNIKEKLVELLCKVQDYGTKNTCEEWSVTVECKDNEIVADHLIANGVTVKTEPMTNADRIRAMSDEELAEFLFSVGYNEGWDTVAGAKAWLKQPAE